MINKDTKKHKIVGFYESQKRMPSFSELAALVGVKSKNAVAKLVKQLALEDFLDQDDHGRLLPGRLFSGIRMLGAVEAGLPSPAEEVLSDVMSIDSYLIKNREKTFMLKVSGESMKNAGIMDGDMVLVERNSNPREGDIVIAEVDHGWTMKYLRKDKGRVFLEPANEKFKNIYPEGELNIAAIVKGVIRKY
jgi:repressor LexA